MISAKIILDSICQETNCRITTMELCMPRIILAEFNTHRAFSRNSASSRAVSVAKKIEEVDKNPFVPLVWGKNQKGMQSKEEIEESSHAQKMWIQASRDAIFHTTCLTSLNLHKQFINRLLEPFLWHTVLVTSTGWENFFVQRCSSLAEPHMEMLANRMKECLENSIAQKVAVGSWHLPFVEVSKITLNSITLYPELKEVLLVGAARCARVSYQKHGQETRWEDDLTIGHKLLEADPPHWSPFEHMAMASSEPFAYANFRGWQQARHHPILSKGE